MIRGRRELEELHRRYVELEEGGDDPAAVEVLHEIVERFPRTGWAWFDLGLRDKWTHDWTAARDHNQRALDLERTGKEQPAAWNLGIAATALGEWALARAAWAAYGIELPGEGRIEADLGPTPVRLNPEPRYPGQKPVLVDWVERDPEVVWGRRLCPARVRIENVPLPSSGHRFGDVVLHDGVPEGTRTFAGQDWSVFEELALLERSPHPTLTTELVVASPDDIEAAEAVFADAGAALECWSRKVRLLCKACSNGSVSDEHDHAPDEAGGSVDVGMSASVEDAERLLAQWQVGGAGRSYGDVVVAE